MDFSIWDNNNGSAAELLSVHYKWQKARILNSVCTYFELMWSSEGFFSDRMRDWKIDIYRERHEKKLKGVAWKKQKTYFD